MPDIRVAITSKSDPKVRKLVVINPDDTVEDIVERACIRMKTTVTSNTYLGIEIGGKLARVEETDDIRSDMELILVNEVESPERVAETRKRDRTSIVEGNVDEVSSTKQKRPPKKSPQSSYEQSTPAVDPPPKKTKSNSQHDESKEQNDADMTIFEPFNLVWAAFSPSKSKAAYWPAYVVSVAVKGSQKQAYTVVDLTPNNHMFKAMDVVPFCGSDMPAEVQNTWKNIPLKDRGRWTLAFKVGCFFQGNTNKEELEAAETYRAMMWVEINSLTAPIGNLGEQVLEGNNPSPKYGRAVALCQRALQAIDKYTQWLAFVPHVHVDEGYTTPNIKTSKEVLKIDTLFGLFINPIKQRAQAMKNSAKKNIYDNRAHLSLASVLLGFCHSIEVELMRRLEGVPGEQNPINGLKSRMAIRKKATRCELCNESASKGPCEEGFVECYCCFGSGVHVTCATSIQRSAGDADLSKRWICTKCRICLNCGTIPSGTETKPEDGWRDSGRFCCHCFSGNDGDNRCGICLHPRHDATGSSCENCEVDTKILKLLP